MSASRRGGRVAALDLRLGPDPRAFGGLPADADPATARFCVLPLPYEGSVTWQAGTARGPQAILDASANMELYDVETASEPWRRGIVTLAPVEAADDPEAMTDRIEAVARPLFAAGRTVVGLGGEHSVTVGLVRAAAAAHPGLAVLQLDAHADTRDQYEGSRYNHACVMARVRELCPCVQVGIRSLDASEAPGLHRALVHYAHEIDDVEKLSEQVLDQLDDPVYVTIDLDVLDPAEMPSTGTPEPGGLRYRQVTTLLREICRWRKVVGFDVVELMPRDHDRAPDFLAARLAYQMMAYVAAFDEE